jgi:hypothetical protein
MEKPKNTHFAVYYDEKGDVIAVEGPGGVEIKKKVKLSDEPLHNVDGLACTLVVNKRGRSPCCIVHGGWEWCWC